MANIYESLSNDHIMLGCFQDFVREHLSYAIKKREKEAEKSMAEAKQQNTMKVLAYDLPRDPPDADPFYVLIYYHPSASSRYMVTSANGNLLFTDGTAAHYLQEQKDQDRRMLALGFPAQADGAAQFQMIRSAAVTASFNDMGEPVSPVLRRGMCQEAVDYAKQAGWLKTVDVMEATREERKMITKHYEVTISPAHWGMNEYTVNPPNGDGWDDGDELVSMLRSQAEMQGADFFELGKDTLPREVEDISPNVVGEISRIFAVHTDDGKVTYYGTLDKDFAIEMQDTKDIDRIVPFKSIHNYEIQQATLFDNNRGFALACNPNAPATFVTWQYTEESGIRDFYWGHYWSNEALAQIDFDTRVCEYAQDNGVSVAYEFNTNADLEDALDNDASMEM